MNRSNTLAAALFCVFLLAVCPAIAQENAVEKQSFQEKLSAFQNKVKQRFDALRGFDKAEDQPQSNANSDSPVNHFHFDRRRMNGAGQRQGYQNRTADRSASLVTQAAYVQPNSGNMARPPAAGQVPPPQGSATRHYDPPLDYRNDYPPAVSSTTYSLPNQGRPTNGVQTVQPNPMIAAQGQAVVEPQNPTVPMAENPLRPDYPPAAEQGYADPSRSTTTGYAEGHFQNGFSRVRTLTDQQQVTASERVLRLQAQVETLIAEKKSLMAENKRLNGIISENRRMLGKAQASIGASLKQIDSANRNNAVLKQQLERLMAENKSQKAQSERTLDAIRQRLDEVLIREISSN